MYTLHLRRVFLLASVFFAYNLLSAQDSFKPRFESSSVYAGIEVGSKGVKNEFA